MKDSLYGKWYQTRPNEEFCIQVADNMYMCADSTGVIWDIIGRQGVKENPKYRYSDIGFYILRRIIENVSKQPIEKYVDEQFYKPLGLNHTTYLPLKVTDLRIPEIWFCFRHKKWAIKPTLLTQ